MAENDASSVAVGALLSQKSNCKGHQTKLAIQTMTIVERRYSACEQEMLAVVFVLWMLSLYFLFMDHRIPLRKSRH